MIYEETLLQKISYTHEDVMSWTRKFAAMQLGINIEQINPQDLEISIPIKEGDVITVTYKKHTSNQKDSDIVSNI